MPIISKLKFYLEVFKNAGKNWNNNEPFRLSAIIAYYTIFSLPGLLVIVINVAGYFFGKKALSHEIYEKTHTLIGDETANSIERILANSFTSSNLSIASILSIGTMVFGATGVFYQMKKNLNIVWGVEMKKEKKILKLLKDRFFSFGMILAVGFLLLVSMVLSSIITGMKSTLSQFIPESLLFTFQLSEFFTSLLVITILFAALFKFLPDVKVKWKNIWMGAFTSALLFDIAKVLLGYYFRFSEPGSTYGAAGGIILLMIWVAYSAMILMFGAEITKAVTDLKKNSLLKNQSAV